MRERLHQIRRRTAAAPQQRNSCLRPACLRVILFFTLALSQLLGVVFVVHAEYALIL